MNDFVARCSVLNESIVCLHVVYRSLRSRHADYRHRPTTIRCSTSGQQHRVSTAADDHRGIPGGIPSDVICRDPRRDVTEVGVRSNAPSTIVELCKPPETVVARPPIYSSAAVRIRTIFHCVFQVRCLDENSPDLRRLSLVMVDRKRKYFSSV